MSVCNNVAKPNTGVQHHRAETSQTKNQQSINKHRAGSFRAGLKNNCHRKFEGQSFSNLVDKQLSSIRADRSANRRGGAGNRCGSKAGNQRPHHAFGGGKARPSHHTFGGGKARPSHHTFGGGKARPSHHTFGSGKGQQHCSNSSAQRPGHHTGGFGHHHSHHSHHSHGAGHHHQWGGVGQHHHSHHSHTSHGHHHHGNGFGHHHHQGNGFGHHHTDNSSGVTSTGQQNGGNTCGTNENNTVQSTDKGVTLQIKGLLQGAYNADNGLMTDALREQNLLPGSQPYSGIGHAGTETLSAGTLATVGNDAPTDWVLIELRDKNNPDVVISSQAAVIQRDGDVANADTNSTDLHFDVPEGDYFVTLGHRNHLDVTTSQSIALSGEDGTLVDFTNPATLTGQQFANIQGEAALWAGDTNGDNSVTAFGPGNDADTIVTTVLTSEGNQNYSFDHVHSGYSNSDTNLDGFTILNGENSDKELVNANTQNASENSTESGNFVLQGSTERK